MVKNKVRAMYLYKLLRDEGLSPAMAKASLAGFMSESGVSLRADQLQGRGVKGIDKAMRLKGTKDLEQYMLDSRSGKAAGLFQADMSTKIKMYKEAKARGVDWWDERFQIKFFVDVFSGRISGGLAETPLEWYRTANTLEGKGEDALIDAILDMQRKNNAARRAIKNPRTGRSEAEPLSEYLKRSFMPFDQWASQNKRKGTRADKADYMQAMLSQKGLGTVSKGLSHEMQAVKNTIKQGTHGQLMALAHTMFFEKPGTPRFASNRLPDANAVEEIAKFVDNNALQADNYKTYMNRG